MKLIERIEKASWFALAVGFWCLIAAVETAMRLI